jgi:DHA2 family multidrug resistance protein
VTPYNAAANPGLQAAHFDLASRQGLAMLNGEITRQASMIAYLDDFQLIMVMTLMLAPLLLLFRRGRKIDIKHPAVVE